MRVHEMIVAERQHMAELLASLSEEELARQSLCDAWTVHEVGAHLVSYLRFGQPKIYLCMLIYAGNFAPGNERLACIYSRRSTAHLVGSLRRHATARTTVPRSGYDPVLTDLVLHDLDIRIPLAIDRVIPEDRLAVAFHHLASVPSPGFDVGGRLRELRFEAVDTGWTYGHGAPVRGDAEAIVLAMAGRTVALPRLDGDGVAILSERVNRASRIPAPQRLRTMAATLLRPSPRRARHLGPPTPTSRSLSCAATRSAVLRPLGGIEHDLRRSRGPNAWFLIQGPDATTPVDGAVRRGKTIWVAFPRQLRPGKRAAAWALLLRHDGVVR